MVWQTRDLKIKNLLKDTHQLINSKLIFWLQELFIFQFLLIVPVAVFILNSYFFHVLDNFSLFLPSKCGLNFHK